jgi:cytochrome c biogenesis protein CcmG/thiol:disulfide interchange protein DsbE
MRVKSLLLIVAMFWAVQAQADAFADFGVIKPKTRVTAPDFSLSDMDGRQRPMSSYQGKVVLLHFWATHCLPCRKEMPILHHMHHDFDPKDLELVCVSVDKGGKGKIEGFMNDIDLQFNTLLDPDGDVRKIYEVRALPTTYLIASDGKISGRIIGERDWKKAGPMLESLLAEAMPDSADKAKTE